MLDESVPEVKGLCVCIEVKLSLLSSSPVPKGDNVDGMHLACNVADGPGVWIAHQRLSRSRSPLGFAGKT